MLTKIDDLESELLAPYAMKTKLSKGRVHPEKEHPYRSLYQRDKDRIIHSAAFRRLEYKTQVFVNHEGDYYRTRLTHTLEVAQIARTISRSLKLNEDLTESIALAHDLGHTPFGHSGEDALSELMKDRGGFDHNRQGLRVVDILEERYLDFNGLNLSWEVREGIIKHSTDFDHTNIPDDFNPDESPSMETQVVDVADEIAYDNHDLDDGLASGLIIEEDLDIIPFWKEAHIIVSRNMRNKDRQLERYQIIKYLINLLVTDVIEESEKRIQVFNIDSIQKVRKQKEKVISFGKNIESKRRPLKAFLLTNLYQHYRVVRMSDKAKRFIKELFNAYIAMPKQLPTSFQKKIEQGDKYRVICDYIAGMTDRFALDEYKKLFYPYEKV
ncbi:MAG: deoxyguanosinetriphosphate triphosphohydrolase [Candidatus Omnitrophota bacterium]